MPATTLKYIRTAEGHFQCPHCDKVTEKQNTMYYHVKKNHTEDLPFQCKKCADCPRFLQKGSYLLHLAAVHPEDADDEGKTNPYAGVSYTCSFEGCGHSSQTKANVLIHFARSHCKSWIPSFTKGCVCSGCAKEFNSSSAYLYHCVSCLGAKAPETYRTMISRIA